MSPVPAAQVFQRAIAISVAFWAILAAWGIVQVALPRGAFLKSPPPERVIQINRRGLISMKHNDTVAEIVQVALASWTRSGAAITTRGTSDSLSNQSPAGKPNGVSRCMGMINNTNDMFKLIYIW